MPCRLGARRGRFDVDRPRRAPFDTLLAMSPQRHLRFLHSRSPKVHSAVMDMWVRSTKSRALFAVALLAALVLTGCGGAEARKARHLEKGQAFYAANNFEKARVEFRNALQIAPTDSAARYENGVVDEKLGNV